MDRSILVQGEMMEKYIVLDDLPGKPFKIVVRKSKLTPQFLAEIKKDKSWNKYRKLMKAEGYDIEATPI